MSQPAAESELISAFLAIAREAAGAGPHAFREWVANPQKYLRAGRRYELPLDPVLRSIEAHEVEKIAAIVDFFAHMSVQRFIKSLEDGRGSYKFEITIQQEGSPNKISLVNDEQDRNLYGLL